MLKLKVRTTISRRGREVGKRRRRKEEERERGPSTEQKSKPIFGIDQNPLGSVTYSVRVINMEHIVQSPSLN